MDAESVAQSMTQRQRQRQQQQLVVHCSDVRCARLRTGGTHPHAAGASARLCLLAAAASPGRSGAARARKPGFPQGSGRAGPVRAAAQAGRHGDPASERPARRDRESTHEARSRLRSPCRLQNPLLSSYALARSLTRTPPFIMRPRAEPTRSFARK